MAEIRLLEVGPVGGWVIEIVLGPHFRSDHLQKVYLHLLESLVEVEILGVAYQYCSTEGQYKTLFVKVKIGR